MPPFQVFRYTGFSKGLYAPANIFDQPKGSLPRISNMLFTERGGLVTVDGTHQICTPGPSLATLGFVTSGQVASGQPPAPVVVGATSADINYPGGITPGSLTLPLPSGLQVGDVVVGWVTNEFFGSPGVGFSCPVANTPSGWNLSQTFSNVLGTMGIFFRVIDGTEGSTVTFSATGTAGGFSHPNITALLVGLSGANKLKTIDVTSYGNFLAGSSGCVIPGVVTTAQNDLLIMMLQMQQITSPDPPAGTVQDTLLQDSISGRTAAAWSTAFVGPGATGNFLCPTDFGPLIQSEQSMIGVGAGNPPDGNLEGFPLTASGAITPKPIIEGSATLLTAPQGCIYDSSGNLWIADRLCNDRGAILEFTVPGSRSGDSAPAVVLSGALTFITSPYDVAVDGNGRIYVANHGGGNVLIFPSGSSGNVGPSLIIGGTNTGLVAPIAVAVDSAGNVYVLDDGVDAIYIWKAGLTGNVAASAIISGANTQLANPLALRISPAGTVWVATAKTASVNAKLLGFSATAAGNAAPSTVITTTALNPDSGLGGPTGLAFDAAGNFYVAVLANQTVLQLAANATGAATPAEIITGFTNGPYGVAAVQ